MTTTEKVKELWNIWDTRVLILLSLLIQVLLTFLAPLRKRCANSILKFVLWLLYLSASAIALYVISHITGTPNDKPEKVELLAFWAPFLLLHLGGPDTITALALEDNELWHRHALELATQRTIEDCVMGRVRPNVLITGTPGTGKTTTATALAEATQLRHVNIGDLVREKNLHDGWDQQFDCHVINEDLVCDELEDIMVEGGVIVDYHGCDFFPERWFDRVVVLQTNNTILYDRLTKRGYSESKLSNNIECEIFQMLLEEAKESYPEDVVVAMKSDSVDDITRNVEDLTNWVSGWGSRQGQNMSD